MSAIALEQAERRGLALALEQADDQAADLRLSILTLDARQPLEIQAAEQLLMNAALQLPDSAGFRMSAGLRNLVVRERKSSCTWTPVELPLRLPNSPKRAGDLSAPGFPFDAGERRGRTSRTSRQSSL